MVKYHLMMRDGQVMVKDQLTMKKSVMDHLFEAIYRICWLPVWRNASSTVDL